jgi:hypothetical protein
LPCCYRRFTHIFQVEIALKHTRLKRRRNLFLCHFRPVNLLAPRVILNFVSLTLSYSSFLVLI